MSFFTRHLGAFWEKFHPEVYRFLGLSCRLFISDANSGSEAQQSHSEHQGSPRQDGLEHITQPDSPGFSQNNLHCWQTTAQICPKKELCVMQIRYLGYKFVNPWVNIIHTCLYTCRLAWRRVPHAICRHCVTSWHLGGMDTLFSRDAYSIGLKFTIHKGGAC